MGASHKQTQEQMAAPIRTESKPLSSIIFAKFDTDGDGTINSSEFRFLCNSLGYNLTDDEIKQALLVIDKDWSGSIDLNEFVDWWRSSSRADALRLTEEELKHRHNASLAFKHFDKNNSGAIGHEEFPEFFEYLKTFGMVKPGMTAEKVLEDMDVSGDAKINFYEYVSWLERIGSLPQKTVLLSL
eukprot:c8801_g1_i1.p1 GENE.c8801_g1_i1~~c8801_g1_i1.p1  ORF type:complete len:185 (-),score=49.94 c8801_g1_i1:277-831(-)